MARQIFSTASGTHIVLDHVSAIFTGEGSGAQVGGEFYELTQDEAAELFDRVRDDRYAFPAKVTRVTGVPT